MIIILYDNIIKVEREDLSGAETPQMGISVKHLYFVLDFNVIYCTIVQAPEFTVLRSGDLPFQMKLTRNKVTFLTKINSYTVSFQQ